MYSDSGKSKVFLLGLITFVLATATATALNIETVNEPLNMDYVSNGTDTVRIVNVTDNNEPLDAADIGNDFHLNYTYNATGGKTFDLEHLASGYWYADIEPVEENGSYVDFRVEEKAGTEDEASTTEQLSYGNYSLELVNGIGDRVTPGEEVSLRVNVTDEAAGEPETGAEVTAYFTNGTHTLDIQGLENQDGSEYYNSQVNTPENYGGTYILHINASNTGDSYIAPEGSVSIPVQMEPPMTGEIDYLETNAGCNNSSFFRECERSTEISTGYNVTGAVPNSVNFSIEAKNRSSGNWELLSSTEMENNSLYEADVTLPDLNNTAYERGIRLEYNATGDEVDAVETYTITIRDYQVRFGAATSTRQGGEYNLELAFERYFSAQPLDASRIDADINVSNSTDTLKEYNLSDLNYEDGVFQRDVQVGADWPEGTYDIDVKAEDIYGNTETAENSFFVNAVDRTFNVTEEIDEEVITAGVYEFNVTVENLGSSELNLTTNASEDIEEFTEMEDYVIVPGDEEQNITVEFNLTGMDMEDRSGEIVLEDEGGFNDTADIELDIPDCDYRDGAYCLEGELNESTDDRGYALEDFDVYYLANASDEEDIDPSTTGNLSDVLVFEPSSVEMNSSNNEQSFIANYSAFSPGYYSGDVEIGSLEVPVSFTSEVESKELSISVTDSVELGTVPEGESGDAEIEVENTGDVTIDSVSFESTDYSVSGESREMDVGDTESFDVEISDIQGSGSFTVTAESATQETSESVSVEVETVPDLEEQASELRTEINDLQSQVTSSENQDILNSASLNVTEIQNEYNAGNYEEAQAMYQATESSLEEVRSSLNTGGSDTSDPGGSNTSDPSPTPPEQGGGPPLALIGIIVFVLLLVGFIVATSYVPEKGDPLYGVLGK